MKIYDSGMPEETYWNSLFDIENILKWIDVTKTSKNIVEIGCGYGTFTLPLSRLTKNNITTYDIDNSMIEIAKKKIEIENIKNVIFENRDVFAHGTGLDSSSVDLILLFNILHFEERKVFLDECSRILKPGGFVAIIHWRKDVLTPRGPKMELRPDLEDIKKAINEDVLKPFDNGQILKPYHWGIQLVKQ